jgi:hypothetical protein
MAIAALGCLVCTSVVGADAWRQGEVCRTRMGPAQPALQRLTTRQKMHNVTQRTVQHTEAASGRSTRMTAGRGPDAQAITGRSNASERPGARTRTAPRSTRRDSSSTGQETVDFIDKNRDGYDDRVRVNDL